HRDLPLLTIDPPGSRDLDQAFFARRRDGGYRVHYAIADVAAFVRPGGELDREAWARGQTLYMPDMRAPLHPAAVSEGAASLLPEDDRPALLWTIDLGEAGEVAASRLVRAVVRSRRAMSYAEAQAALDGGPAGDDDALALLREVGRLREDLELGRGGVSLNLPTQQVTPAPGGYRFSFEAMLPVEGWNAQISLLAGHCAARIMAEGGVGILRTLPPIGEGILARLRRAAEALEIDWPEGTSLGALVQMQDGGTPESAAFLVQATHALRGAGYAVVDGTPPVHGALGMVYAHVTAPLRRLVDRYANEVTVALCADASPPGWLVEALARLPETMAESDRRSDAIEAAVLNLAEAVVLGPQVGRTFAATVIDRGPDRATVQLRDPPVVAKVDAGGVRLGERIRVRLTGADPVARRLDLEVV
ncbi:MAG: RNB domain-containing ribonuclease, partial [Actinomycetota bacterium]